MLLSAGPCRTARPLVLLLILLAAPLAGCIAYQEPDAGPAPAVLVEYATGIEAEFEALRSPADGSARYGADDFVVLSTARSASGGVAGYVYTVPDGARLYSDGKPYLALLALPVGDEPAFGDDWMLLAFAEHKGEIVLAGSLVSASYDITSPGILPDSDQRLAPSLQPRLLVLWGELAAPGDEIYLVLAARGEAVAEFGLLVTPIENDDSFVFRGSDDERTTADFLTAFDDPRPHVPFNPGRAEGALFANYRYDGRLLNAVEARTPDVAVDEALAEIAAVAPMRRVELSSTLDRHAGWSLTYGRHTPERTIGTGAAAGRWELDVDQFGRQVQRSGVGLTLPFSTLGGVTEQPLFSLANEGTGPTSSRFLLEMGGSGLGSTTRYEHFAFGATLEDLVGVASTERSFVGPHVELPAAAAWPIPSELPVPWSHPDDLVVPGPGGAPIVHIGLAAALDAARPA